MKPNLRRPILMHTASALLACALLAAGLPNAQTASAAPPNPKAVLAPQAPEATPIVGGTSFSGAAQLSPDVEYSSTVSTSATDDFYYYDVTPGQIATLNFTTTTNWPDNSPSRFYLFDQLHVSAIGQVDLTTQEQPGQFIFVGNTTTPTRYYFRVTGQGVAKDFLIKVTLANQADGGVAGDAGDTSATARVITSTVGTIITITGNGGGADSDDWYRINVAAGQRISVTGRILDYGTNIGTGNIHLIDTANAASYLKRLDFIAPSLEPLAAEWMGNSTTPTAYLIRAHANGGAQLGSPWRYQIDVVVTDQTDGGPIGDAGDTAITARVITPTLGVLATYTGTTGQKDSEDWLRINAVSGMRISVTMMIADIGTSFGGRAWLRDAANASSFIDFKDLSTAGVPKSMSYMGNNTTPVAYLIHMAMNETNPGAATTYRITLLAEQQTDGTTPGDAGDDFDSARVITPTLDAQSNLLGSADNDDYYKIDLPIDTFTGAGVGVPYKIFVAPVPWPNGSSGSLRITKYAANRSQIGQEISILAPTTDGATIDLTNCDGCYVKVTDGSSGTPQLKYIFTLLKPFTVYAPFIRKP